jgi:hypothetical protein
MQKQKHGDCLSFKPSGNHRVQETYQPTFALSILLSRQVGEVENLSMGKENQQVTEKKSSPQPVEKSVRLSRSPVPGLGVKREVSSVQ